MLRNKIVFALLVVAVAASSSFAATYTLTPTVTARFDDAFNPLPLTSPGAGPITDGAGIYQIDLNFTIAGLVAGERGWANTSFDVMLMGNLTDAGGYAPDNPNPFFDTNGGLPGGGVPKYSTNQDAGTAGDLQGLLASIAGGPMVAADPRKDLGKAGPSLLGSIFARSTGIGTGEVQVKNVRYSLADEAGLFLQSQESLASSILFGEGGPPTNTPPVAVDGQVINDVMSGAGMTLDFNFQATDAETAAANLVWSNLQFSGLPGNGGDGTFFAQPTLGANGAFSWNLNGAARGVYTAVATVTDTGPGTPLTDTASLTINVTKVPEPSTVALCSLAMVGLVGLIRRRS